MRFTNVVVPSLLVERDILKTNIFNVTTMSAWLATFLKLWPEEPVMPSLPGGSVCARES